MKTIIVVMDFNKFVEEVDEYQGKTKLPSIKERYLIPFIPTLGKFLIDYFSENKINYEYYISMFISLLLPIVINDMARKGENIKKVFAKNLISVYTYDENMKKFLYNLNLIYINKLLKVHQEDKNKGWVYCENKLIKFHINNDECYNLFLNINDIEYNFFIIKLSDPSACYISTDNLEKLNCIIQFVMNYETEEKNICVLNDKAIINVNVNDTDYNKLILSNKIMEQLNLKLNNFTDPNYNKKMKSLGFKNNLHIHLHGIPGSGKTTIAMAIANKLDKDILLVDKLKAGNFFENLDLFKNKSYVFLFDDIDFWDLKDRHIVNKEGENYPNAYLMKLMELLNGNTFNNSVMIFTSNTENFNEALFRDGRIHLRLDINGIDDVSVYEKFFKYIYDDNESIWRNNVNNREMKQLLDKKLSLAQISEIAKKNIFDKSNFILELKKLT